MFTLEQIQSEHAKVKSGADFPGYICNLKALGVQSYRTYVADGHTLYAGAGGERLASQPRYGALYIEQVPDRAQFNSDLKLHQQGGSDYKTFCMQAALSGVAYWECDLDKMTCTYFSAGDEEIFTEAIPS